MKKIFTLALSAMLLGGVNASAQTGYTILEDLTASKIQNANFTEGEPVGVTITTYDYNMTSVTVGESDPSVALFGMRSTTRAAMNCQALVVTTTLLTRKMDSPAMCWVWQLYGVLTCSTHKRLRFQPVPT